jgi:hypothetical protein
LSISVKQFDFDNLESYLSYFQQSLMMEVAAVVVERGPKCLVVGDFVEPSDLPKAAITPLLVLVVFASSKFN